MAENPTAAGTEAAPARREPLVVEERRVRLWAIAGAHVLVVNAVIVALGVWRVTESGWSRLSERCSDRRSARS